MYINKDSNDKNIIKDYITTCIEFFKNNYYQLMCCWVVLGLDIFKGCGIILNLVFLNGNKYERISKSIITILFFIINWFNTEELLMLFMCNLITMLFINKISFSIIKDIIKICIKK